jgi:hypothetical protein
MPLDKKTLLEAVKQAKDQSGKKKFNQKLLSFLTHQLNLTKSASSLQAN